MYNMRVCVIGHFGFGENLLNGQTVKTKIITKELEKQLGKNQVGTIDSRGGFQNMIKLFWQVGQAMKRFDNVIMLPAHNGVRFFSPLLVFWKKLYRSKIHYAVIGGWLASFAQKHKLLCTILKKFDNIFVETSTMKMALENLGFKNITVIPNCKDLYVLKEDELVYSHSEPYKLCTFSRVMEEKGIEDAITAIKEVNEKFEQTIFELDIYGQVDERYVERFKTIQLDFPEYIQYKGLVSFEKSVEVLKDYYALLFPTKFYTEGIPGTIIDAYASGIPVVSSRWESFSDIIEDGIVGRGYSFDDYDDLVNVLMEIAENPNCFLQMKKNCLKKAINYVSANVVRKMIIKME